MALTKSRNVDVYLDPTLRTFKVKGSTTIFRGGLIGLSAGYARELVAGDSFVGISDEEVVNAGADGAASVRVRTVADVEHVLSGAAQTDVSRPVFASADDTLTFASAGNSYVGTTEDVLSSGLVIVRIDPNRRLVKTIVHSVENLGAGVDIAARAIHSFNQAGWIVSARVVNQATAAVGVDAGNSCVVALANTAGAVATETFDATPAFPGANASASLGAITNPHCPAGDVLTLAVTNGATADPGPFLVEVDYV